MLPGLTDIARRERAGMMLFAGVVCLVHYPLDVFVLDLPDTGLLRLAWTLSFLAAGWLTLRGSELAVTAAAHALGVGSMIAVLSLAHLSGGPDGYQFWWLLVFPLLAALISPGDWHAVAATTVAGLVGTPLLFAAWDLPTVELLLAELALLSSAGLGIFACLRYTRQRRAEHEARTSQAQLEVALADSEQRRSQVERLLIQERFITLGNLTAGMTHDLNNALGALLANLDFVREDDEALQDANEAGEHLRAMLKDLSGVARSAHTDASTDVSEVVRSAVRLSEPTWRRRAPVEVAFGEDLPRIGGTSDQWIQVIVNLVLNAVEATSNKAPVRLTLTAVREGVQLTIDDGGNGIAPADIDRVFEPFYSTRPGHTGLGLLFCRQVIEELGGVLELSPSERGGTCATVFQPRAVSSAPLTLVDSA